MEEGEPVKRDICLLFLLVMILVNISTFLSVIHREKICNDNINSSFEINLREASDYLALDYDKMTKEEKIYSYNTSASYITVAANIASLTTYNRKNDLIDIALQNLVLKMRDKKHTNLIIKDTSKVYYYIEHILKAPEDIKATNDLINYINNLN